MFVHIKSHLDVQWSGKMYAVVRTSFQYELKLKQSIRLADVVTVTTWVGFLLSLGILTRWELRLGIISRSCKP